MKPIKPLDNEQELFTQLQFDSQLQTHEMMNIKTS